MRESQLLAHIAKRSAGMAERLAAVLVGPGDDAAVIQVPDDAQPAPRLVVTVDHLIERRHFRGPIISETQATPIDLIARKAVARSISDLAAMTARPLAALATAALPTRFPQPLADKLFDALHAWAERFGAPLVGGDLATYETSDAAVTLTVTAIGTLPPGRRPALRSGAQPGDAVYVTGALGGSFDKFTGLGRHLTFEPRIAEADAVATLLGDQLHALIDVSDGLGRDAGRVARQSGVRLDLAAAHLPISPAVPAGPDRWLAALRDGEDYELLFTAPADAPIPTVIDGIAGARTPITRIGAVVPGEGAFCIMPGGRPMDCTELGWDH